LSRLTTSLFCFGVSDFQQTVDILMGSNCAPGLAEFV
jgi:hypothetical protein